MTEWAYKLRRGNSPDPKQGACLMDAVSWSEYGRLGDRPECVCPTLVVYGITLNDLLPERERQQLRRFIPLLPGTRGPGLDLSREMLIAERVRAIGATVGVKPKAGGREALHTFLARCVRHGRYTDVAWSIYEPAIAAFAEAIAIGSDGAIPVAGDRIAAANRRFELARAA